MQFVFVLAWQNRNSWWRCSQEAFLVRPPFVSW